MKKFISNNKDIRGYILKLIRQRQAKLYYGSKHPYLILDNQRITIPSSPSCKRAIYNFQHDVKRLTGKK